MKINIIIINIFLFQIFCSCHRGNTGQEEKDKNQASESLFGFMGNTEDIKIPKKLPPIEYARWIENKKNGLNISQQQGSFIYELQYQPVEYLVVLQERKEQIEPNLLKEEVEKRGDLLYFTFKMYNTADGKGILSNENIEIENKESYLLSGIQNDFVLLNNQDTLSCVMCYFERSNNLIPYDQCVLAFEEPRDLKKDITFLYRTDKYQKGWVKINIKRKDINKVPQLKTI